MDGLKEVYNQMDSDIPDQIDRLIEVMNQLKGMVKDLDDPYCNYELIMGLMVMLIRNTEVPDVTILSNNKGIALA